MRNTVSLTYFISLHIFHIIAVSGLIQITHHTLAQ